MNPWLNLRSLLETVAQATEMGQLDERSQRLLEWVVHHHNPSEPTFVQTIVNESGVASPATVHKCLSILEDQGLLSFQVDTIDTRRRIVSPTDKAIRLLKKLDDQVVTWAKAFKSS
ncbi:MAG: hypothetical protein RL483_913 [Pseudomonadota bacterium]|jgi:DNA-binding MarR family transcriptional regulator